MRRLGTTWLALATAAACGGSVAPASDPAATPMAEIDAARVLGAPPLCEASGAVPAPWDPGLVLVVDNEISDRLFGFRLGPHGTLVEQEVVALPGAVRQEDLEALAVVADKIVAVGSHSRSKKCRPQPERQRMRVLRWDEDAGALADFSLVDGAARWSAHTASLEACVAGLFTRPLPELCDAVCEALVAAERAVTRDACVTPDVEGAVGIPGADGVRLWIGLRRPRVNGRPVLLRLTAGLDELRFDGVASLNVGDRGVRALALREDQVWAVLGPTPEATDSSTLWRAPAADIVPGALVRGEIVADGLPPSSEGLVIDPPFVIVLTDGEQPRHGHVRCEESAGQVRVRLR